MARGSKAKYTSKQIRQAEGIARGYKKRGWESESSIAPSRLSRSAVLAANIYNEVPQYAASS